MFEKFFKNELNEMKKNKVRVFSVTLCFLFAVTFAIWNFFDTGEEIDISDEKISDKKNSDDEVADEKIKVARGANSDILFVQNPFAIEVEEEIEIPQVQEKIVEPIKVEETPPQEISPPVEENFYLLGTAVTAEEKFALLQITTNSSTENFFATIGDIVNGRRISDISADSLTFDDGTKIFVSHDS